MGPYALGARAQQKSRGFRVSACGACARRADESGVFSGGAVIDKEKNLLHLLYTRHYERENVIRQTQYHAYSSDGVRFTKTERAAIGEELLPEGFTSCSFRDPNPVVIGDTYYVVVGAQTKERAGAVLVYSSRDMERIQI